MFTFDKEQIKKTSPLGEMIAESVGVPVDCGGLDLKEGTPSNIPGIFKQVEKAYSVGNPVVAKNLLWEGAVFTPAVVAVTKRPSGNFICTFSTLQIEIEPDDDVTVINMLAG